MEAEGLMASGLTEEELPSDFQLMESLAAGDEDALVLLIRRWQRPLVNFAYRSLGSREDAEEIAQQVFIRLYRASSRYQPTARFSTYLFQIARRLILNEIRRRGNRPASPVDPHVLGQQAVVAEDPAGVRELEEAFQWALRDLPENHRTALLLYQQQELSYAEIASVMEASESAVKTWIFRARQQLKETLRDILP